MKCLDSWDGAGTGTAGQCSKATSEISGSHAHRPAAKLLFKVGRIGWEGGGIEDKGGEGCVSRAGKGLGRGSSRTDLVLLLS